MKRYLTIAILSVLLAGCGYYITGLQHERDDALSVAHYDRAQAKIWRDQDSLSRIRIETLQVNHDMVTEFYADWVDSLTHDLDTQAKWIESATSISSVTERIDRFMLRDTIYRAVNRQDTIAIPAQTFSSRDRWRSLEGTIVDMELNMTQRYYDSITVVNNLRRDKGIRGWVLGKRTMYTDAINYNPYATFKNIRTYRKSVRPLKFGIGPYVGYDFSDDITKPKITFGISIQYSIIQF